MKIRFHFLARRLLNYNARLVVWLFVFPFSLCFLGLCVGKLRQTTSTSSTFQLTNKPSLLKYKYWLYRCVSYIIKWREYFYFFSYRACNFHLSVERYIYVICRLRGPYSKNLWPRSWKSEVTVFTTRTDPKPAHSFLFPALNWLTSALTQLCYWIGLRAVYKPS